LTRPVFTPLGGCHADKERKDGLFLRSGMKPILRDPWFLSHLADTPFLLKALQTPSGACVFCRRVL